MWGVSDAFTGLVALMVSIIDALVNPQLLGGIPCFKDLSTWPRWLVLMCACYGLPLTDLRAVGLSEDEALAIYRHHTGRSTYAPPPGGFSEVVCIVGRQAAKSRIAATIVDYEAICAEPEPDGTELYCALIAQDQRAALRTLFSYTTAPFDQVPALMRMVPTGWRAMWKKARRADSLTLENGVRVAVYPSAPRSVRGIRARVAVCDELAFFRNSAGEPTDSAMLTALRPTLATTGGKLVILSSPYAASGALYELHRRHFGRDGSSTLVWVGTAPEMNPTLSPDYLRRMEQDDPEAYRSEVLGEFRAGLSQLFGGEALGACVESGVRERRPAGHAYVGFVDAASGSGQDAFTVAIAHSEGERAVLDVVRAWPPPFSPSSVIAEASALLKAYGLNGATGDKYAAGFVLEGFRSRGIEYQASERDRSTIYLELLPLVNAGAVTLLDDPELLRELRGLERRRGPVRDRVDHPSGQHDDRANSAAGALVLASSGARCRCGDPECDGLPPMGLMDAPRVQDWYRQHPWMEDGAGWQARVTPTANEGVLRALFLELADALDAADDTGAARYQTQIAALIAGAPEGERPRLSEVRAAYDKALAEVDS